MNEIQMKYFLYSSIGLLFIISTAFIGKQQKTISSKELFVAYTDMSKLDVALEVKAFIIEEGQKEKNQIVSYEMEYRNDNTQRGLWYTMDNQIILRNEKWALQINNEEKTIIYYNRDPKKATQEVLSEEEKTQFAQAMKEYIQEGDVSFTYLKKEGNLMVYQTKETSYPIKKATFWLNTDKHIVKTTYDYHPNQYGQTNYVEVYYKKFDPTPSFDKQTFSEKKYIRAKGKEILPTAAFKDYKVINAEEYMGK